MAEQDELEQRAGAIFSPCRTWRYVLWRRFDWSREWCAFIGLNPSKAHETKDDPTIRRCIQFSKDWGYGGLTMLNLFAYRATNPLDMLKAQDPVGQDNDRYLVEYAEKSGIVIAAWGVNGTSRAEHVTRIIPELHCLEKTKHGHPRHPLYVRAEVKPVAYSMSALAAARAAIQQEK